MIILGMTGPISHGKTTFANALAEFEPSTKRFESSLIIAEVVNAWQATFRTIPAPEDVEGINNLLKSLPSILQEIVHVNTTVDAIKIDPKEAALHPVEYQKLLLHLENLSRNPNMARTPIGYENKEAYRPILQWVGGYLVQKVDPGIWYNEIVRRILVEQSRGVKMCLVGGLRFPEDANILRKAGGKIVKVYRPGFLQNDILDPTERERENITADTTVMCNGTIEDVRNCAKIFYEDLIAGKLQPLYQALHFHTADVSKV